VYERINIGGYLLWMAVLAAALLRDKLAVQEVEPPIIGSPQREV
jgi:hypothetical protein